jgi:hypothetical protein
MPGPDPSESSNHRRLGGVQSVGSGEVPVAPDILPGADTARGNSVVTRRRRTVGPVGDGDVVRATYSNGGDLPLP